MVESARRPQAPPHARTYRFGGFEFHTATGDLTPPDANGANDAASGAIGTPAPARPSVARLAPQPARLLTLLLERPGALVTHEEIHAALWPDVEIEFDQGVHFCIRQIRSALGDSAATPQFIRTLPRRGYQWMTAVTVAEDPVAEASGAAGAGADTSARTSPRSARDEQPPAPVMTHSTRRRRRWAPAVAIGAVLLAVGLAIGLAGGSDPVRIAIMPFTPPGDGRVTVDTRQIATHLVATLTADSRLRIIGPTTTERFASDPLPARETFETLDVQFIVNGRFAERDGRVQLLFELIRAGDGAHVVVAWFDDLERGEAIADAIARQVRLYVDALRAG